MRRGIPIADFNKAFLAAGGTIERDTSSHALYKFPGLPTYGTHQTNREAPGKLVSMLRRIQTGAVVSSERAAEPVPELEMVVVVEDRHRFIQRPNPPRPVAVASLYDLEVTRRVVESIEAAKPRAAEAEREPDLRAEVRQARVILGTGFSEAPGVTLVWYGLARIKHLQRCGGPDAAVEALVLDLSDPSWTRERVDAMTRVVEQVKGRCDLLPTAEWGTSPEPEPRRLLTPHVDHVISTTAALIARAVRRDIEADPRPSVVSA